MTSSYVDSNQESYISSSLFRRIECSAQIGDETELWKYEEFESLFENLELPKGSVVLIALPNSLGLVKFLVSALNVGLVPALIPPSTPTARVKQTALAYEAAALIIGKLGIRQKQELNVRSTHEFHKWNIAVLKSAGVGIKPGHIIVTTSGTSSTFNSGCLHHISSLKKNAQKHAESVNLTSADVVLINLPIYYSTALVAQLIAGYVVGAKIILSGAPFNTATYIKDLKKFNVTSSALTPVLMRAINRAGPTDAESISLNVSVGGDKVGTDEIEQFIELYPNWNLYLTYGTTEAGPRISTCAVSDVGRSKWESVGLPLSETKVLLVGETENKNVGELYVSSETLLVRKLGDYDHDPTVIIDERRWLPTGDIFEMDSEGFLYFVSRKSDFIVVNDEKVNLAAIKSDIKSLPEVVSCSTSPVKAHNICRGYDLKLLCDARYVNETNVDKFTELVLRRLKKAERPLNTIVSHTSDESIYEYK